MQNLIFAAPAIFFEDFSADRASETVQTFVSGLNPTTRGRTDLK